MILSVYVDEFKMGGREHSMKKAWSLTRGVIALDDPKNLGTHLGCGHEKLNSVSQDVVKASMGHVPFLSGQSRTTSGSVGGDSQRQMVQTAAPCGATFRESDTK